MRKTKLFFVGIVLSFVIFFAACSSPEEDEVLDYHNDFVDHVNPILEEIEVLNTNTDTAETDEEVIEIQEDEMTPLIHDIKDYVEAQEPESDIAKEYHQLRLEWARAWSEAIDLENEAYDGVMDGSLTGKEAAEKLEESEEKGEETVEAGDKADEKWKEIKEEYDFKDADEEV